MSYENLIIKVKEQQIIRYLCAKVKENNIDITNISENKIEIDLPKYNEDKFGDILSDAVLECYYPLFLGECIRKNHIALSDEIKTQIILKSIKRLWFDEKLKRSYKSSIKKRFNDCICGHKELDINGFITFRLGDYKSLWERSICMMAETEIIYAERRSCLERLKFYLAYAKCKTKVLVIEEEMKGYLVYEKHSGIKRFVCEKPQIIEIIAEKVPEYVEFIKKTGKEDSIYPFLNYLLNDRLRLVDK